MYGFFAQLRLYYTISMEMGQSDGLPDSKGGDSGFGHACGVRVHRVQKRMFLRWTGLTAGRFLSLTAFQAEGCGIALRAMSIIMPPFGGHVHIEYHNHSYHRPPLRHFVALFP